MEGLDKELLRQEQRVIELDEFILSSSSQLERENEILRDLKILFQHMSILKKKLREKIKFSFKLMKTYPYLN